MTEAVVFETPGLLDLKAATTFGINVKKGLNPIGYFGTGLKYAIAVLVREGISVTIYIGPKEYVFYKKASDFRGKEFDFVMMKQRNSLLGKWSAKQMPFTTEFGKNWELWQAFRELESNTRDEGGKTFLFNEKHEPPLSNTPTTWIVVEGEAFRKVWENRGEVFLDGAETAYDATSSIQVFKRPSKAVYYRGLKVMELAKPSKLTYNVLAPVQLTEDRTVKFDWELRDRIMQYIACNCKDHQVMNEVITADEKETWEGSFPFDQLWSNPSEQFMTIIRKKKARETRGGMFDGFYKVAPRIDRLYTSRTIPPRVKQPVNGCIESLQWSLDHLKIWDDYASLHSDIKQAIEILKTHEDYDPAKLEVVMVPKNPPAANAVDIGDDIPF